MPDGPDAWARPEGYAPPARRKPLPPGALAGLILVAVACGGAVFVLDWAFGRPDIYAEEVAAGRDAVQVP